MTVDSFMLYAGSELNTSMGFMCREMKPKGHNSPVVCNVKTGLPSLMEIPSNNTYRVHAVNNDSINLITARTDSPDSVTLSCNYWLNGLKKSL